MSRFCDTSLSELVVKTAEESRSMSKDSHIPRYRIEETVAFFERNLDPLDDVGNQCNSSAQSF